MALNTMQGLQNVDLSGGIGGLFAGIQNRQVEEANKMAIVQSALNALYRGAEADRYQQETPHTVRDLEGKSYVSQLAGDRARWMNTPERLDVHGQSELDIQRGKGAEGRILDRTADATITAKNRELANQAEMHRLQGNLMKLEEIVNMGASSGPASGALIQQALSASGLAQDPVVQQILRMPKELQKQAIATISQKLAAARKTAENISRYSPTTLQERDKQLFQQERELAVQRLKNVGDRLRQEASERAADQRFLTAQVQQYASVYKTALQTYQKAVKDAEQFGGPLNENTFKQIFIAAEEAKIGKPLSKEGKNNHYKTKAYQDAWRRHQMVEADKFKSIYEIHYQDLQAAQRISNMKDPEERRLAWKTYIDRTLENKPGFTPVQSEEMNYSDFDNKPGSGARPSTAPVAPTPAGVNVPSSYGRY
jgi:hypothetical protein